MALKVTLTIDGLRKAQDANKRRIVKMQPKGLSRVIQIATLEMHRLALIETPVDTGSWRASHLITLEPTRGIVFVDPSALNSRSGGRVIDYATEYEQQGGRYAVYKNTAAQHGSRVLQAAAKAAAKEIANA